MKYPPKFLAILALALSLISNACVAESLMDRIKSLEPKIGGHPPSIQNEEEFNAIKKEYEEIKSELDTLLESHSDEPDILFMRGHLQSMGHNIDYPGAWQSATNDLKALLAANPEHIPGILELAYLWVNSDPALAPNAERLFRGAQCLKGNEPLEDAQNGLFFAFYFQGKMKEAFHQSEYLKQMWPQNARYQQYNETIRAVLTRKNIEIVVPTKLSMCTCEE